MKTIIYISILFLINHFIVSKSYSTELDGSLSDKAWIELGIPLKISRPEHYGAVSRLFIKLSTEGKNVLPKYDSKKSGSTFNRIFNKNTIDSIASQKLPYEQIQKNLMAVHEL